jgi:hypothetical protein
MVVVVKVEWFLGPFSIWYQGKWGNLCCDGWFHCRGTCSIEVSVCMGLGLGHDSKLRLTGCIGGSLVKSRWASFMQRPSKVLLPVLWWPTTISVDVVHRLWVIALIIFVTGSWSFV